MLMFVFLSSLVEASTTMGTVFSFGQFSNFYSFTWKEKPCLLICPLFFFVLVAYSVCFYPLSFRYKRK